MSVPEQQQLKLDDVYDNLYKGDSAVKRYCPQCGHKTLRKGERYMGQYPNRRTRTIWACTHNMQPRTYRGEKHSRKPCDLVLAFDDRDAKIEDYGGVLGQMSRIHIPPIQSYLLEKRSDVNARGMKILYEGPLFDVVRRRNTESGVGVGLYWKAATYGEDEDDLFDPRNGAFDFARSEAAHYVMYRGFQAAYLLDRDICVELWQQGEDEEKAVFKGARCGKRMEKEIIDFCKAFEVDIPKILGEARDEDNRWKRERQEFKRTMANAVGGSSNLKVSLVHYCGERKTATFDFPSVRPSTAALIQDLTEIPLSLSGLSNATRHQISFDEAQKIERLLGVQYRVSLRALSYHKRFNIDMAVDLAKLIAEDQSS